MSYPRYAKYRDSGVAWLGEVPAHWEVRRLKHVCYAFPSNVDKKSHENQNSILLCNYTDVYYNDEITSNIPFMEATASDEEVAKFKLEPGDTIITKDSETPDDIAVSAYVPEVLPGVVCGYHLTIVRPSSIMFGRYVKRLFDSTFSRAQFAVAANGLTRFGLSQYAIDNALFPIPPFAEQSAIAAFLDRETGRIDALVAEQEKLMALLAEKRQAVISHAVTKGLDPDAPMKESGVEWLGNVPKHWEVVRIKHLTRSIEQGWSPQCDSFPVEGAEDWGVLKVGCVNGGTFNPEENKKLPAELEPIPSLGVTADDLLISRANTRELVGGAAVVHDDYPHLMLCDKLYRIRLDRELCLPDFLARFLGTNLARGQIELAATGASRSMLNIDQRTILELDVPVPPISEQSCIMERIHVETARLDALTAEARRAIELLKERRAALISAAVTGRIDVRGLVGEKAA